MNLLEYFFSFFKSKPLTKEEELQRKIRVIETRRAEAMLKLERERQKSNPDPLIIDKYEHELKILESELNEIERK